MQEATRTLLTRKQRYHSELRHFRLPECIFHQVKIFAVITRKIANRFPRKNGADIEKFTWIYNQIFCNKYTIFWFIQNMKHKPWDTNFVVKFQIRNSLWHSCWIFVLILVRGKGIGLSAGRAIGTFPQSHFWHLHRPVLVGSRVKFHNGGAFKSV